VTPETPRAARINAATSLDLPLDLLPSCPASTWRDVSWLGQTGRSILIAPVAVAGVERCRETAGLLQVSG